MNDDGTGGAPPRSFAVLVIPAPVVSHGVAVEKLRILRGVAWVIDQHDHGLAGHVDAFVVVPAPLRCVDAVTDEDQFGVLDDARLHLATRPDDLLGSIGEHQIIAVATPQHEIGLIGGFHRRERHVLRVAVSVGRFQVEFAEPVHQVVHGKFLAGGSGSAPAESIGRQRLDVPAVSCFVERLDAQFDRVRSRGRHRRRSRSGFRLLAATGGEQDA